MGLSLLRVVHVHAGHPYFAAVSCPQCSSSTAIVFDRPPGHIARFCVSFQLVVPQDGDSPPPQTPVPPAPALPPDNDPPSDWFSHGPSDEVSIALRLECGDPTPPGSGTQSWLFCILISFGLALAESRVGVPHHSTGNREQVPSEQSQFWTAHALPGKAYIWTLSHKRLCCHPS